MITVDECEAQEVRMMEEQAQRILLYRNQFLAFLGRKYKIDLTKHDYDIVKGAFIPKGEANG